MLYRARVCHKLTLLCLSKENINDFGVFTLVKRDGKGENFLEKCFQWTKIINGRVFFVNKENKGCQIEEILSSIFKERAVRGFNAEIH